MSALISALATVAMVCLSLPNMNAMPSCEISISTLAFVTSCPKNEKEWTDMANKKNCEVLARYQNCTSARNFSYHCILNDDASRFVEVCAPQWFMTGYCTRFSLEEKRIINDPKLDCTKFSNPCPSRFSSKDAYKYQDCYVKRDGNSSGNKNGNGFPDKSSPIRWTLIFISCGLLIALIVMTTLFYTERHKKRTKQQEPEVPITDEHIELLRSEEGDTEEKTSKDTKASKMQITTLSEDKKISCAVNISIENQTVMNIADLKAVVAEVLETEKDSIEIVNRETATIYQDETFFRHFLKHEETINVVKRYKSRKVQPAGCTENGNENLRMRNFCNCLFDPDQLFNHIHCEIMQHEGEKITCPTCSEELDTNGAFFNCNMSHDEKILYQAKLDQNMTVNRKLEQIAAADDASLSESEEEP